MSGFHSRRFMRLPALIQEHLRNAYSTPFANNWGQIQPYSFGALAPAKSRLIFRLLIGRLDFQGPELEAEIDSCLGLKHATFLRALADALDLFQSGGPFEHPEMTRFNHFLLRYWDSKHPSLEGELFRYSASDLDRICSDVLGRISIGDGSAMKMAVHRLKLPTCGHAKIAYPKR
jgi:hypothetical protein